MIASASKYILTAGIATRINEACKPLHCGKVCSQERRHIKILEKVSNEIIIVLAEISSEINHSVIVDYILISKSFKVRLTEEVS